MPGTGWKPDTLDPRDYKFAARPGKALPLEVDLRPLDVAPQLHQGNIGSCTANSFSYAFDFLLNQLGREPIHLSRLFHYYNTRILENTVDSDSGATIRNTIKAGVEYGACPGTLWLYTDIETKFKVKPNDQCYQVASKNQVIEYLRVEQNGILGALAEGYPIIFGMLIYEQFYNVGRGGIIEMPPINARPLGGHSQFAVGYRTNADGRVYIITRNSWGSEHGDNGYLYIPLEYLTNPQLANDFWIIKNLEQVEMAIEDFIKAVEQVHNELFSNCPIPTYSEDGQNFYVEWPGTGIKYAFNRTWDVQTIQGFYRINYPKHLCTQPPLPPEPDYYVGPGVRKLMDQLGDTPAGIEWYPRSDNGIAVGWSITPGRKYLYIYVEAIDTVWAITPDKVLVGTK